MPLKCIQIATDPLGRVVPGQAGFEEAAHEGCVKLEYDTEVFWGTLDEE